MGPSDADMPMSEQIVEEHFGELKSNNVLCNQRARQTPTALSNAIDVEEKNILTLNL